jgi:hypothetical protein
VIGLDRIVLILLDVVPGRGKQLVEYAGVDRRGVGDHLARRHLQLPQRPDEESSGSRGVPAGRERHVDDLTVLVDRPADVTPHAVDLDVGLVDVPSAAG